MAKKAKVKKSSKLAPNKRRIARQEVLPGVTVVDKSDSAEATPF